jgi:hypothetical protein
VQPEKLKRKGFPVIYAAFTFWLFLIAFMGIAAGLGWPTPLANATFRQAGR